LPRFTWLSELHLASLVLTIGFGLKEEVTVGNDALLNVLFAAKYENARRVE
jgi:hypothetical protein